MKQQFSKGLLPFRLAQAVLALFATTASCQIFAAQSLTDLVAAPTNRPAVIELVMPKDGVVTLDGKEVGTERTFTYPDFGTNKTKEIKLVAQYPGGLEIQRLVELDKGRHLTIPLGPPAPDKPVSVLMESDTAMLWAAFSRDMRYLATSGEGRTAVVWDLRAGRPLRALAHTESVTSVNFSPNNQEVMTSSLDGLAILWNINTGQIVRRFKGHTGGVMIAIFNRDGSRILTGSQDNNMILWDAKTGAQIRSFTGHTAAVLSVAFSPDGKKLATGSTDRTGAIWDAETGKRLFTLRARDELGGVVFSSDGAYVAAASYENAAYFWDAATGGNVGITRVVNLDLNGIAFSPDDRWAYTAGKDSTIKQWNAETMEMKREISGHTLDVMSVNTSPDGHYLVTASRDGTARIWESATGAELLCLTSSANGRAWSVLTTDGLFDASEAGRTYLGYRFSTKLPGGSIGQFFRDYYRPGLLAEVLRGDRPIAPAQLAQGLPPTLKIVAPRSRATTNDSVMVEVEATDRGGGVSSLAVYNNGARMAVTPTARQDGNVVRYSFKMPVVRGLNQIRMKASNKDGSWESIPAELDLTSTRKPDRNSRHFVVAIGIGDYAQPDLNTAYAAKDAQSLADFLRRQGSTVFDRVDVVPLLGRDATRARIIETLKDVAALSQPHDAVTVIFCGRAGRSGEQFFIAPQELKISSAGPADSLRAQGLSVDDLAAILGTAGAQKRVMILDGTDFAQAGVAGKQSDYALRGTVERLARAQGMYVVASLANVPRQPKDAGRGLLTEALLGEAGDAGKMQEIADSNGAVSLTDWFSLGSRRAAASLEQLGLDAQSVQQSSQSRGFALVIAGREK